MNNRKKIFIAIIAIILVITLYIVFSLPGAKDKKTKVSGDIKIWIVGDSSEKFEAFFEDFKKANTSFSKIKASVVSFDTFEEYEKVFASALAKGEAPDIFVLNNNGASFINNQAYKIPSEFVNIINFRSKFKTVFSDDLIRTLYNTDSESSEYIKGVPIGYETLGVYHNPLLVRKSYLTSFTSLINSISEIKKRKPKMIPVGLGDGSSIYKSSDILSQMLLLDGINSIIGLDEKSLDKSLYRYTSFQDIGPGGNGNNYNSKSLENFDNKKNNLDLFLNGDIAMFVGYPRLVYDIDKSGYPKSRLAASPFPHNSLDSGKTLINYNYFAMNKDSENEDVLVGFFKYILTKPGAKSYLEKFPYYMPAQLALEDEFMIKKVHNDYNLIFEHFYDPKYELSSFEKGIGVDYDTLLKQILNSGSSYGEYTESFISYMSCQLERVVNLRNIGESCEPK